jgi:hypothetical protein
LTAATIVATMRAEQPEGLRGRTTTEEESMKASEAMLLVELELEGVHEVGFNNRGPQVEEIQKADDLPGGGYAWCCSLRQFVADLLGVKLPAETASVGLLEGAYRKSRWMVNAPTRGADGFWRLDAGTWPDHIFCVEEVVSKSGGTYVLKTIEGNTSKGFGSVDDGGGCYRRTRSIPASQVTFGVVKGTVPDSRVEDALAAVRRARKQGKIVTPRAVKASAPELPEEALYWMWLRWRLGEGEFKKQGPGKQAARPKVLPKKVPLGWWERQADFVAARKAMSGKAKKVKGGKPKRK